MSNLSILSVTGKTFMLLWFLLAGTETEELKKKFNEFCSFHKLPNGLALWKWKKTCWICSPDKYRNEILSVFTRYNVIEFSSAPSPTDVEFLCGDKQALSVDIK